MIFMNTTVANICFLATGLQIFFSYFNRERNEIKNMKMWETVALYIKVIVFGIYFQRKISAGINNMLVVYNRLQNLTTKFVIAKQNTYYKYNDETKCARNNKNTII